MTLVHYPPSVTHPDVQSDVPTNANEHCVGTESDLAYILPLLIIHTDFVLVD